MRPARRRAWRSLSAIHCDLVASNRHFQRSERGRCARARGHRPATTPRPATHWGNARVRLATVRWLHRYVLCCGMGLWFLAFLPRLHAQPTTHRQRPRRLCPLCQHNRQGAAPARRRAAIPLTSPPAVEIIPPRAPLPPLASDASAPSAPSASDRAPAAAGPRALMPEILETRVRFAPASC